MSAIDRLTELRDGYRELLATVQHLKTENAGLETPGPKHQWARAATPERYGAEKFAPRSDSVRRHVAATRRTTRHPVEGSLSNPPTPIRQVVDPSKLGTHAGLAHPSSQAPQTPIRQVVDPSKLGTYAGRVHPSQQPLHRIDSMPSSRHARRSQPPAPFLSRTSNPPLMPSYSGSITPPARDELHDHAVPSSGGQPSLEPPPVGTAPFINEYPLHQPQAVPTSRSSTEGYYPRGSMLPQHADGSHLAGPYASPSPGVPSVPPNGTMPQHINGGHPMQPAGGCPGVPHFSPTPALPQHASVVHPSPTPDFIGPFLGPPPTVGSFPYAHANVLFPAAQSARHASPLPFAPARAASPLPTFQRGSSGPGQQRRPSAPPRLFTNPLVAPSLTSAPSATQHGCWENTSALQRGGAPAAPHLARTMQWLGGGAFPIRVPQIGVQPLALMSLTENATQTIEFKHHMARLGFEKMERVIRARLLERAGAFFDRMLMLTDSQPLSRISRGLEKLSKIGRALDGDVLRSVSFSRLTDTVCRGPDIQLAASMELYNLSSLIRYAISMQLSWAFSRLQAQGMSRKARTTVPVDRRNFASQVHNAPHQIGEATSTFAMLKKI